MIDSALTEKILGCCYRVHTAMGAGLLESVYEECLCEALNAEGFRYERQKQVPIVFEGKQLSTALKIDLVVESKIIIELKSVKDIAPIHFAQLLTYMKLSKIQVGYIINFNTLSLKDGIYRRVLT